MTAPPAWAASAGFYQQARFRAYLPCAEEVTRSSATVAAARNYGLRPDRIHQRAVIRVGIDGLDGLSGREATETMKLITAVVAIAFFVVCAAFGTLAVVLAVQERGGK